MLHVITLLFGSCNNFAVQVIIPWGTEDNLIPMEYADKFVRVLQNDEFEKIGDAGHSPFVEKTAIVYERLRTFLIR